MSVWLPRLAETICDTLILQRLCPLPLSVAEDVLILICFIDYPEESEQRLMDHRSFGLNMNI